MAYIPYAEHEAQHMSPIFFLNVDFRLTTFSALVPQKFTWTLSQTQHARQSSHFFSPTKKIPESLIHPGLYHHIRVSIDVRLKRERFYFIKIIFLSRVNVPASAHIDQNLSMH